MAFLIDTHCHLHDREFFSEAQAEEMLKRAHEKGVKKIICIGTSHEDSMVAAEFAAQHENVYWTYGVHPEYATQMTGPVAISHLRPCPSGPSPWADGTNSRAAALRNAATSGYWRHPS